MAGKRGPYAVGEKRKTQILEATERLVNESGHTGLTVRMVADSIGITDAAVYHHFASKDALLVELLRYREAKAPERALLPDMAAVLISSAAHSQETPHLVALLADFAARATDPEHPAHDLFAQRYTARIASVTEGIRVRQKSGEVSDRVPAEQIATLLFAVTDGLNTHWLVTREIDMAASLRAFFDLLRPDPTP